MLQNKLKYLDLCKEIILTIPRNNRVASCISERDSRIDCQSINLSSSSVKHRAWRDVNCSVWKLIWPKNAKARESNGWFPLLTTQLRSDSHEFCLCETFGFLVGSTMSELCRNDFAVVSYVANPSPISPRDDDDIVLVPCRKSKPNGMAERMVRKYYDNAQTLCNCIKISFDPTHRCMNSRCLECELPFVKQRTAESAMVPTLTVLLYTYLFHCESDFFRQDEKKRVCSTTPITIPRMRNEKIISVSMYRANHIMTFSHFFCFFEVTN